MMVSMDRIERDDVVLYQGRLCIVRGIVSTNLGEPCASLTEMDGSLVRGPDGEPTPTSPELTIDVRRPVVVGSLFRFRWGGLLCGVGFQMEEGKLMSDTFL
jgi:hypothetical protein